MEIDAKEKTALQISELLLEYKAEPNALDNNDLSPLHIAALNQVSKIVELLIKHKANPNAKSKFGKIPLHYACINPKPKKKMIKLLIKNSTINLQDNEGNTPLDAFGKAPYSYDEIRIEILRLLLKNNAKTSNTRVA